MRALKILLVLIFPLLSIAQPETTRINIQRSIQQCTHNNVPVRFGGIAVQGCFVVTDALGRQTYAEKSSYINNNYLYDVYTNIVDNTDTLFKDSTDLSSVIGVASNIYTQSDSIDDDVRYVKMDSTPFWATPGRQELFIGQFGNTPNFDAALDIDKHGFYLTNANNTIFGLPATGMAWINGEAGGIGSDSSRVFSYVNFERGGILVEEFRSQEQYRVDADVDGVLLRATDIILGNRSEINLNKDRIQFQGYDTGASWRYNFPFSSPPIGDSTVMVWTGDNDIPSFKPWPPAGGSGINWAENNLTLDANRQHDFASFDMDWINVDEFTITSPGDVQITGASGIFLGGTSLTFSGESSFIGSGPTYVYHDFWLPNEGTLDNTLDSLLVRDNVTGEIKLRSVSSFNHWKLGGSTYRLGRDALGSIAAQSTAAVVDTMDSSGSGDAIAFQDASVVDRSGLINYIGFEASGKVIGVSDYDSLIGFRANQTLAEFATAQKMVGFEASMNIVNGNAAFNVFNFISRKPSVDGSIANLYGLYIEDLTEGSDNYGVFQKGSASNVFEGDIFLTVEDEVDNALDSLLVRDNITGEIKLRSAATLGGGGSFSTLSDVDVTGIASGDYITWNGSNYVDITPSNLANTLNLEDLGNVTGAVNSDDVLVYSGIAWVLTAKSSFLDLEALTDVDLTSPAESDIMVYSGTQWVNTNDISHGTSDAILGIDGFTGNDSYITYKTNSVARWSVGVDDAINSNLRFYNESLTSTAWSISLATNTTTVNNDFSFASGADLTTPSGIDLVLDPAGAGNVLINDILEVQDDLIWVNTNNTTDYAAALRLTGEGTIDNYQGIYIQYDASGNQSVIGTHNTNDALTSSDIELITLPRDGSAIEIQTDLFMPVEDEVDNSLDSVLVRDNVTGEIKLKNYSSYGFMSFSDASVTITATGIGTYDPITNGSNTLFANSTSTSDFTIQGDSIIINCDCTIELEASFSFSAGNSSVYEIKPTIDGTALTNSGINRGMSGSDQGVVAFNHLFIASDGDVLKLAFEETAGSSDPIFSTGSVLVKRL